MTNQAESTAIDNFAVPAPAEVTDSDELKMRRFLRWMEEQGATFPAMTMKMGQGARQVHATRALLPGELVLHVPRTLMITPALAKASETGKLMAQSGSGFGDYEYIAAFLLQAEREGGFWKPYVDVLPKDYSQNALFFSESELDHLKGSYIAGTIRERIDWDRRLYDRLPSYLKENGFTREAFTWARCAVISRVYGVTFAGKATVAMVPLADMFDHAPRNYVRWIGEAETGFIVTAQQPVEAGAPLFERYGKRCNAMLLNVYGFCLEDNPDNEAEILLQPVSSDHAFFQQTGRLGAKRGETRAFKVQRSYNDAAQALLSYLRLACYDEPPCLQGSRVDLNGAGQVLPISRRNETAALSALVAACESRLQQFPTSIEEDEALLKDASLQRNVRNIVMVRRDEKVILKYFLDLAQTAFPLLQDAFCDVGKYAAAGNAYSDYFADVVRHLGSGAD